jgi:hypothetical protein
MTVATLASEVSSLTTTEEQGIINLGVRDRVVLKVAKTAIDAVSAGATASGFSSNVAFKVTSGTNGEISVTGMTSNGAVVITPMEACPAVHVVPAAGKVTVFEANTTNVIDAKKLAVLILAK